MDSTEMRATTSEPRAGAREWVGLAVLALPLLVLALDISVLYLAAPQLAAALEPSATQQLWILDIYGFLIAGFLLTMGTVGDRIGRRRLLLIGAAAFAAASVLAAFAPSAEWLIAARAILGMAGATLMPSTLALITTMFPEPTQRRFAVAVWMTTFSVGAAVGPLVGGLLLTAFWWGAAFLLGVPAMALLLILGPRLLPEHRVVNAGRPDLTSVGLSLVTMLPLVYGVKQVAVYGPDATSFAAIVLGVAMGVLFVWRQRRLEVPMFDVALFTRRSFATAVTLLLLSLLAVNGLVFLLPQYLQLVAGQSVLVAGLWLLPVAGVTVAGALLTPVMANRFGPARLVAVGALVAAVAALALGWLVAGDPLLVVVLAAVIVLGVTPTTVLGTDLVIGSVPAERAGSAAAISETAGELGVALGVAVTGSILAAVYGARLALPPGLPVDVAATAQTGLAGALEVAERLPAQIGAAVTGAARAAFTAGFGAVGMIGAGLLMFVVVLALTSPRSTPSTPSPNRD